MSDGMYRNRFDTVRIVIRRMGRGVWDGSVYIKGGSVTKLSAGSKEAFSSRADCKAWAEFTFGALVKMKDTTQVTKGW